MALPVIKLCFKENYSAWYQYISEQADQRKIFERPKIGTDIFRKLAYDEVGISNE